MTSGKSIWLATVILLSLVLTAQTKTQTTQTQTKQSGEACSIPQSPRDIQDYPFPGPYNGNPNQRPNSLVTDIVGAETIKYKGQTLLRCDQHYHVPVENTQGCTGERSGAVPHDGPPSQDQWVEIHTVYSPHLTDDPRCKNPVDEGLFCCQGDPKVVRGFSAKVEDITGAKTGAKTGEGPIIPANGRPLAEWTGSNTGGPTDCPGPCKDVKAEWSSLLTCEITVTQHQLEQLGHAHEARCPQLPPRLSNDLTLVATRPPQPLGSCHLEKAPSIIDTDARAQTVCPAVCRPSGKSWQGQWITWDDRSECGCCTSSGR